MVSFIPVFMPLVTCILEIVVIFALKLVNHSIRRTINHKNGVFSHFTGNDDIHSIIADHIG